MIAVVIISLALLGISGLLIDSHRRAWREARDSSTLPERDKRFAGSLYRRRMLASGTIGAIGAGIALWPLVPRQPLTMAAYLAMLLAACTWIMLLALLDFWATRQHYRRLRSEQRAKQVHLAIEMAAMSETAEAEGEPSCTSIRFG